MPGQVMPVENVVIDIFWYPPDERWLLHIETPDGDIHLACKRPGPLVTRADEWCRDRGFDLHLPRLGAYRTEEHCDQPG